MLNLKSTFFSLMQGKKRKTEKIKSGFWFKSWFDHLINSVQFKFHESPNWNEPLTPLINCIISPHLYLVHLVIGPCGCANQREDGQFLTFLAHWNESLFPLEALKLIKNLLSIIQYKFLNESKPHIHNPHGCNIPTFCRKAFQLKLHSFSLKIWRF